MKGHQELFLISRFIGGLALAMIAIKVRNAEKLSRFRKQQGFGDSGLFGTACLAAFFSCADELVKLSLPIEVGAILLFLGAVTFFHRQRRREAKEYLEQIDQQIRQTSIASLK